MLPSRNQTATGLTLKAWERRLQACTASGELDGQSGKALAWSSLTTGGCQLIRHLAPAADMRRCCDLGGNEACWIGLLACLLSRY